MVVPPHLPACALWLRLAHLTRRGGSSQHARQGHTHARPAPSAQLNFNINFNVGFNGFDDSHTRIRRPWNSCSFQYLAAASAAALSAKVMKPNPLWTHQWK
jgi:hypothetical protein